MFLKRVTLCGFKSFCDRVDFEFTPGVTGIVGPNGCGKSNVVDAFKWVLGEQSVRALRGRQMTDMIFNGSKTRKSSSVAQVDLVFDNSDRSLPMDCDEVTVTRKLYRSGESEYLLNRETRRLKDVRELFLDTGIGTDGYSLIEQGKVDVLLQSNPQERRAIFEEACGISKYKSRKREAERKLERTKQNLLRIEDIVEELEKRLRSVKLQAGKARSYKQYEARLNELRAGFAMAEFRRYTGEITQLEGDARQLEDAVTGLHAQIDREEAKSSHAAVHLDELGEAISATDNRLVGDRSRLAAEQERIDSSLRRIEEQGSLLTRTEERLTTDKLRLDSAQAELARTELATVDLRRAQDETQVRLERLNDQDRSLARELVQAQATLEDEKAGIIDLLRQSAQAHNEIIRFNTHRESLVGQKGRLAQRDAQIASELEVTLRQKAELEQRIHEVEQLVLAETHKLDEKKAESIRARSIEQRISEELGQIKERRSALQSREELLQDLERNMEGVGEAVRKLMDRKSAGADGGATGDWLVGMVADIFDVDVEHARVIDAALGEWTQYLVVSDSKAFWAEVERMGELPGRLTALCLDRLPPLINVRDFSEQPGFVARAMDLVRYDEAYEELAGRLVGKTIVVDRIESAIKMAASDPAGHRFVTLRGETVYPDGRISLGTVGPGIGLISRKSELRDIGARLEAIRSEQRTLSDQLNRSGAETTHLDAVQQELRTSIHELHTTRVEADTALQGTLETIERFKSERPMVAGEVSLIEQQIDEVLRKTEEGGKSLEVLEQENARREAQIRVHQERIDKVVTDRDRIQHQATETRVQLGQLAEKRTAADEMIDALKRSSADCEAAVATAARDINQCRDRITEANESVRSGRETASSLTIGIQAIEETAAKLRNERETLRLDVEGCRQAVKSARTELASLESDLQQRRLALAEVKVRRDNLLARIQEELGVDLAEKKADESEEQDWEQVEAEISELRAKMDRLGNVNFEAINELQELEERHSFLTSQRDDIHQSHRQLERLIEKLDTESRDRFVEAFEQIRDHFRSMFRKLFGGGRADIVLEDPDNLLDCGIEIVAQPPGKELRTISLMSGGEKSLTAIALLMSIFKSRPAPFAILDEVDAALDEANNDRFNRIIREFVDDTQFIIITHSKWTMSGADRLYGITMHEPGVSTRVSVELSNATNVA